MKQIIRIGSRASRLAVLQSELVMEQIRRILPDAELELVIYSFRFPPRM